MSIALLALMVLLAVQVGSAKADGDIPFLEEQFLVVNSAGIPQSGATVYDYTLGEQIGTTDSNGWSPVFHLEFFCEEPGLTPIIDDGPCDGPNASDNILTSRSEDLPDISDPCETAPEGLGAAPATGSSAILGRPVDPSTGQTIVQREVVLPTVAGTAYQPTLSSEEEGMVGAINQYREQNDMTPITVSSVLTASADKYLSDLPARALNYDDDSTYCMASSPGIRALDAGFPTSEHIGESVLQNDGNAHAAIADLENDDNQAAISDESATQIGIAQEGGTWVIDTAEVEPNDPRWARTGDTGDYGLVAAEFATPQASKPPKDAAVKIAKVRVKARKMSFIGHLKSAAKGTVKVVVERVKAKKPITLRSMRRGAKVTAAGKLKKAGRYTVTFTFTGERGTLWQSATVKRVIQVH